MLTSKRTLPGGSARTMLCWGLQVLPYQHLPIYEMIATSALNIMCTAVMDYKTDFVW